MLRNKYLLLFGLMLVLGACTNDDEPVVEQTEQKTTGDYNAEVVTEWYDLIKTLTIETEGYTPPVAARAFGYTSIALYESVVPGMPDKVSLSGKLTDLNLDARIEEGKTYHWPTVANTVLAKMTSYFYANTSEERLLAITALEDRFDTVFLLENGEETHEVSVRLGQNVADQIMAWAESDGGNNAQFNNFPEDYVPPVGEEFWVPTPPNFLPALQPFWGSNRPFLMANVTGDAQPVAPPPFSINESSICYQRALEVYNVVNALTPEQEDIAGFWSDDPITTATPPGHSISILNQLIKENDSRLDLAAEAFAKLGIGISDAFISCWKIKYQTVYPRPVTYINKHIDADWRPLLGTPPFPEYTSGHSVQSGALAEIMTDFFGEDYRFTDRTHENRTDINGTPRTFDSFYAMAEEAAVSRLYGGIHFKEAISLGLEQGYQIGKNVNSLKLDKK